MLYPEIARLSGCTDWIDLGFVERQLTPERAMSSVFNCS